MTLLLDVKVLANAGGVNPHQCAKVLAQLAAEQGVGLKIAAVEGDDLMPKVRLHKQIIASLSCLHHFKA